MVTEGARSVILLSLAFVVVPGLRQVRIGGGVCSTAMGLASEFPACVWQAMYSNKLTSPDAFFGAQHPTKDQLTALLNDYCSVVVPAAKDCMKDSTSVCNVTTQDKVKQSIDVTAYLCQASGTFINPIVTDVLSRIKPQNFSAVSQEGCMESRDVERLCEAEAMDVTGQSRPALDALPWDNFVNFIQRITETIVNCTVHMHRTASDTCTGWRARAVLDVVKVNLGNHIGVEMPFTTQQWTDMLQL